MSAEWIKTAVVGQRVVCIDGCPRPGSINQLPVPGREYTIRAIVNWEWPTGKAGIGVFVAEIIRDAGSKGLENPWAVDRFRPVHPRKTDIAWAYELLRSAPAGQPLKEEA